ncbi:MAG: M23 family metallopeptidase [Burkholderiales bacterium]|nr:M23 family metallopeptidase [Burkholderiales bacterium]
MQALGWFAVLAALLLGASHAWRHAEQPLRRPSAEPRAQQPKPQPLPADGGTASASPAPRVIAVASSGADPTTERAKAAADAAAQAARQAARAGDPLPGDTARLSARQLTLPVQGVAASQLSDTYTDSRADGARSHDAIDIMAPTGTPVLAVENGRIAKLFFSEGGGGITLYQFDPSEQYVYYYAHLDGYADDLKEGQMLRRGQMIGHVGYSGNASPQAPHLHFAIFKLGPKKEWWKGEALNPYPILRAP